jgi:tRNA modification GTPase
MYEEDTIVAIATANGIGAISIVRLSGVNALSIALKIAHASDLKPRIATLLKLYDTKDELIDEALLIYFKNPHSFTGEDIVEFQCHGGIAITSLVLKSCLSFGARAANPGEFSKRAFLNAKIDLTQAQAISKMIEAKSEDAVKLLARQLKGQLKDFVEDIRQDLLFMLAYTEVSIDYAEEDLPTDIFEQIKIKLDKIIKKLEGILLASKRREGLIDGFKVAIIGKPNVGKSSLLNKLLNFNRAIVSNIAGTTRDTIEESVKIGSHIIKIVDTAGIRESSDEIEKIGIEKSIEAIIDADIIVSLFDGSRKFDEEDEQIMALLSQTKKEKLIVINKSDLDLKFNRSKIGNYYISLNAKDDISELINKLEIILNQNTSGDDVTLISNHQINEVKSTIKNIQEASAPLEKGELEFFSYHINEALAHMSNITRPYEHAQMLDVMFGEFCLGK